jgi:hypothetical protein
MDKKKVFKICATIIPPIATALSFIADWVIDKEKDEKYVSKEELSQLLKDQKESN